MRIWKSSGNQIAREYRAYLHYELRVRRHVIILRLGVVLAILLGLLNLFLHLQGRAG
jgi:hypothetical protein